MTLKVPVAMPWLTVRHDKGEADFTYAWLPGQASGSRRLTASSRQKDSA